MKKQRKILISDPSAESLARMEKLLGDHFDHIECLKNPNLLPARLDELQFDVHILAMNYRMDHRNGNEGLYWMKRILEKRPGAAVILISRNGNVDHAVHAIKEGASDYIQTPWSDDRLISSVLAVRNAMTRFRKTKPYETAQATEMEKGIIAKSKAMRQLMDVVKKVAPTEANILITGENGTGKELIARAIHRESARAAEVFVHVDMGALHDNLFESELFGHCKGAFTDAREDREGRFAAAGGGTLFLDEIGNLPLRLQSKILSVLQSRAVTRLGTHSPIPLDIRLVSATNMPVDRMVREGRFREDLMYRLNTIRIHIPPLRERKTDILPLFDHFRKRFETKYSTGPLNVHHDVPEALLSWDWPGNVRELEHAVEKAVIMSEGDCLKVGDFTFRRLIDPASKEGLENYNLQKNEQRIIHEAIEHCRGNLSQASRILGITRKTLYNKINKYGH